MSRYLGALIVFLSVAKPTLGQTLSSFEARAQYAMHLLPAKAVDVRKKHIEFQLWFAESLYLRGLDSEARTVIEDTLPRLHNTAHPDDDCFNLIAAVDLMERWSSKLHNNSNPAKDLWSTYRTTLTEFPHWDTAHTSNQILMAATARFLASEAYPDARFASDFAKGDPTGRLYLLCFTDQIATHNVQEFDSNVYSAAYFISLRLLADFARDPEVKQRAGMTYDWLLANAASTWLNSTWAASSFRRYADIAPQNELDHGSWALWPYLGGAVPAHDSNLEHMPGAIQAIASCQCVPGLHKEDGAAFMPRQEILDLASWPKSTDHYVFKARTVTPSRPTFQFMQTSYLAHDYALFGETDFETSSDRKQGTKGSGAAIMSGVAWNPSPAHSAYPSIFYAGAPRWQVDTASTGSAICSQGEHGNDCSNSFHTYGFGRHGQYFQVENAQLAVYNYNIPDLDEPEQFYIYAPLCTNNQYPWKFSNGPIPNFPCPAATVPRAMIVDEASTKGRVYLFYDHVLISLWLSAPFAWDGRHELSVYKPSTLNPHALLASAIEVAAPVQFAGKTDMETLANYKHWIESRASLNLERLTGELPSATYTASDGNILKNTFGETNTLNGVPVDYVKWPLQSTPWVRQEWDDAVGCTICNSGSSKTVSGIGGGGNLVVTSPVTGHRLTYDFTHWTVTPSP